MTKWRTVALAATGIAVAGAVAAAPASARVVRTSPAQRGDSALTSSGKPVRGGTLNIASGSDVDYLDPNLTYYTIGYLAAREYSRQLYTYPSRKGHSTTEVPDLASGPPKISHHGKKLTVTIRKGAKWDTKPARQVTAADEIRGIEITCNPYQPFGGTPDFSSLITGYQRFCAGFARTPATVGGIKKYLAHHQISGLSVGHNSRTVVIKLAHKAAYFAQELTLPALSPRPVEMLKWLPGSAEEAQHVISDGPYKVSSYDPGHRLDFVRNPAWKASSDPVRHAYVKAIDWNLRADDADTTTAKVVKGNPSDDITTLGPTPFESEQLKAKHYKEFGAFSEISVNPYLVFNTQSPNDGGALRKTLVRRAVSFALNRNAMLRSTGPKFLYTPLTHVLPSQIDGSKNFNLYPHKIAKAKALLKKAGIKHLTIKVLYRDASSTSVQLVDAMSRELKPAGIKVKRMAASDVGFYVHYLENPATARHGAWDLALTGWGPDWYGNAAASFFEPLFDGRSLPPLSSNFGLFNDPKVNALIDRASAAPLPASNHLWARADHQVMSDAAIYPLENPNQTLVWGKQVHNFTYLPYLENADPTNIWLSPGDNGG